MISKRLGAGLSGLAVLALTGCSDMGPKQFAQGGPAGSGIQQVHAVGLVRRANAAQPAIPPEPYPQADDSGPKISQIKGEDGGLQYKNVQVLGDVSEDNFNRIMAAMNNWIGTGEKGCAYCHNLNNLASDEVYQKVVARRMLQMTRSINNQWYSHVQQTGVTCWTCHRGNAVPKYNWSYTASTNPQEMRGNKHGQNTPLQTVAYASLPYDYNATYLTGGPAQIRVGTGTSLPQPGQYPSVKAAEATYGLMMHMSSSLGVNCTYCHNTQNFKAWNISSPQRSYAWYGIRMVRDINHQYMESLQDVFPAHRKGPMGDVLKANCGTCHQGQYKPMNGYPMLREYVALKGPRGAELATAVTPIPALYPAGADGVPAVPYRRLVVEPTRTDAAPLQATWMQVKGQPSVDANAVAPPPVALARPVKPVTLSMR